MKRKFTTTIDEELIKKAKIKAIELNISVAELIERLLKDFLRDK
jgi:predicted HicB family RNase H-like nuclease